MNLRDFLRRTDWTLVSLVIFVSAFHFITMPSMFYPGDNFAPRAEVAGFLATGEWGLDYTFRKQLGGFVEERGQYLYENDARQKFFSKYGIGYSLLYLPPLFVEKLYAGTIAPMVGTDSQMFILNVYQILLTLIITVYLYRLAGLYTSRKWLSAAFVLASFYGTFMWHYLRAPTLEIFQFFPFIGAYYHLVCFVRQREAGSRGGTMWGHLAASAAWAGLLFLVKVSYGPFLAIIWMFALLSGVPGSSVWERVRHAVGRDRWRFAACLGLPALVTAGVYLGANYYRCGSLLADGYGQWVQGGKVVARLDIRCIPQSLKGMFLQPDNGYNALIHYPLFVFAWLGVPLFVRRRAMEAAFLGVVVLSNWLLIACFHSWGGAWCYGPRYLIVPMLVGSLPVLAWVEWLLQRRAVSVRAAVLAPMVGILLWSFQLQWHMNAIHYFTMYYMSGLFSQFKVERIDDYFNRCVHRGLIHRDLVRYARGKGDFYPMRVLNGLVSPTQRAVLPRLDGHLKQFAKPNFYFD